MTRTPAGGAVLATALLMLSLSACSTDDPAPVPSSSSTSTTSTPTPTPTLPVPTLPSTAAVKTAAGAESFVGYFWELYNYMNATGATSSFVAVTTPECSFCVKAVKIADHIYSTGGRVEGGRSELIATAAAPVVINTATVVAVTFRQQPGQVLGSDGGPPSSIAGDKAVAANVRLVWSGGAWRVDELAERSTS